MITIDVITLVAATLATIALTGFAAYRFGLVAGFASAAVRIDIARDALTELQAEHKNVLEAAKENRLRLDSHIGKTKRLEAHLEAITQDCDNRIAIFARRTLTHADIATLRAVNAQLLLASQTYIGLKLVDPARHINTVIGNLEAMTKRLNDAMPEDIVTLAAAAQPGGKSWLVHGPQGCGKTSNAQAIADALGLTEIIDNWHPGMKAPITKALVLTNDHGPFEPFQRRVLSFEQAMSLVASKGKARAAA